MSDDIIRLDRGLHFRTQIQELSSQIEFNFLPFETGSVLYNWSPYIFSGISIYNFNPQAENSNGQWVDLQPLGTEGQGTTAYPERKKYPRKLETLKDNNKIPRIKMKSKKIFMTKTMKK